MDVRNCNVNNRVFDEMKADNIPDLVIVKKVRDRTRRAQKRQWKLKRLIVDGNMVGNETASVADEFMGYVFLVYFFHVEESRHLILIHKIDYFFSLGLGIL